MTDESNTKSAGQLYYEKLYPLGSSFVLWTDLHEKQRAKYEFNALAVPKNQTLKLP